ncbi:hypothetical protein J4E93_004381 [Alternaria ventricosa]|uniref:uncharacterized protein n=1 Tax=Alternaria ventricosa TaxID=1187951 RepID=UPI0020C58812|nr:uncharacterized protein J4E93_004381 [Alternaria ventricosa]KAI4647970.1 hypothetical protein J4E93_004381 [Alternaria ventricosa]
MSEAFVPCSDFPGDPSKWLGPEQISLEVGYGCDSEMFDAPLRQLRNTSDYFFDQLDDSSEFFSLPDVSPRNFRIYLDFLKTGYLNQPDSDDTTDQRISFGRLIHVFMFANGLGIILLRNAVLDEFFLRIYDDPDDLPYKCIFNIYKATTPASSLRHLAVDIIVKIGKKADVKEWMHDLPKQFLMDCLTSSSEDRIVPFPKSLSEDDIMERLEAMRHAMCEVFHVHDSKPDDQEMGSQAGTSVRTEDSHRPGRGAERKGREAEEDEEDEAQAQNVDSELQETFDEESAARMEYVMGPLPIRERH